MAKDSMNQINRDAPMNAPLVWQPRFSLRWWVVLIALITATLALVWLQRLLIGHSTQANSAPAPALSIGIAAVKKGDISVYLNALGTVTPVHTVTITSRVSGQITSVNYREGQMVPFEQEETVRSHLASDMMQEATHRSHRISWWG
jgi:hypothetical protein